MVLAFKNSGDIKIEAQGNFTKQVTVEFPGTNITRAEVAIKGFRFDQTASPAQLFDVYAMQTSIVDVIHDTVLLSVTCDSRGKTTNKWEGHINVLVIADIESPPTGSPPTGSPPTG
jgi:hypothetical protein